MQLRITHNVISTIYRIPWGKCDNGDDDDDDDDGDDGDDDNVCVDNEGTPKAVANLMSRFACRPTSNNLYTAHYKHYKRCPLYPSNKWQPIHCPLPTISTLSAPGVFICSENLIFSCPTFWPN